MLVATNFEIGRIFPCERGTQSPTGTENYNPHLVPAAPQTQRCSVSTSALKQFLPPSLILKIPIDRFSDAVSGVAARMPVQFTFGEAGINCVAPIMPEPIGDKRD